MMTILTNPVSLQRLEGAAVAIAAITAWFILGGNWWLLSLLFFLPDLSMVGYLGSSRLGAWGYNLIHSYLLAILLFGSGLWFGIFGLTLAGTLLLAHIGVDRALGYGLKLPSGFQDTHLGVIGKRA
jgi:hypothetical protein